MGTLTADCPRLDSHCPHKLATSCRLSSTPNCCACADERPHSRLYRVYIDGVGYVQRGTRWQSYCWFCKGTSACHYQSLNWADNDAILLPTKWLLLLTHASEFWNNRLVATDPPLEAAQTQIPHIPDQTDFLERWFEFHQGYRIVKQPDGTDTRIAVVGEPFSDVSPGFLPRTLNQLRAGRENDASRPENVFTRRRLTSEEHPSQETHQSIEEALDDLLDQLSEDDDVAESETPAPEQQNRDMPPTSSQGLSRPLTRTEVQFQRARERLVRVFGTREDVQREDYESPLSTMYNRAEERYRQAEERRTTGETTDARLNNMSELSPQERRELEEQILWGVLRDSRRSFWHHRNDRPSSDISFWNHRNDRSGSSSSLLPRISNTLAGNSSGPPRENSSVSPDHATAPVPLGGEAVVPTLFADQPEPGSSPDPTSPSTPSLRTSLDQINSDLTRLQAATDAVARARITLVRQRPAIRLSATVEPIQTLDEPGRPRPLSDAQMTKKLDCQICYSQIADIAVLPCGHMVMCQWCADIAVPVRHSHIPARPSKCPMCRKTVKQRFRIHIPGNDVAVRDKEHESGSRALSMHAEIVTADNGISSEDVHEESVTREVAMT